MELPQPTPRSCRSELIRRGVVVGGDTGKHTRTPLLLERLKRKEKKNSVQAKEVDLGSVRCVTAKCPVLSAKEVEECKSVFGAATTIQRDDITHLEDMLVELGIPDSCLEYLEATLASLIPTERAIGITHFIDLVAELKQRYLSTLPKPEEEMSDAYDSLAPNGYLEPSSLARTAESYNLTLPLEALGTGKISLQKFNTLLSSDHTRAEELFIDLGGTPGCNGGPPTGVVTISNIEQSMHVFGNNVAAVEDVLKLTRLLSGGELTFEEFKDLVFAPIAGIERNPAGIANVRSQLCLAKSLQQFVDYGVGMVNSEVGQKIDSREDADKLFSLLKWCHWKDNKTVKLDTQLASGTLTQALNVILETHANKQQTRKQQSTKPWRRAVAASMRRLSTHNTEQNDALKRAALAMLLKRSVASDMQKESKADHTRNLFLKGIDRAARRADNILSHEGLLNMNEAKHDTASARGQRISKIINEVTALGQEPSDSGKTFCGMSQFDITTPLLQELKASEMEMNSPTEEKVDPLTSAMTDMCTADVFDEAEASVRSETKEALQTAMTQLDAMGGCSDNDTDDDDLNLSVSGVRSGRSTENVISPSSTLLTDERPLMEPEEKPPTPKVKRAKKVKKPPPPTLDSVFEFIKKIPKPPCKPAAKPRPAVLVDRQLKLRTCRVPHKPKVEENHEVTNMHASETHEWARQGRGGGGIGALISQVLSSRREQSKDFIL
eukprot:TRINITY_DN7630_c0_g1_i1.p2 TRINITY_DN7630_c0_g1~~TRINITY_DN7630_c0_g1_i1.p2  ORF type:complete len:723 (+),score=245.59 TRINITY_DN7630_c0_g1_i1:3-2171(+)